MLQKNTVTPELLSTLKELMKLESLQDFRLVGGTALSLQIGHRVSVDIDLFTDKKIDFVQLENVRDEIYQRFIGAIDKSYSVLKPDYFQTQISNVKVEVYPWHDKFIRKPLEVEGIRLAHIDDILSSKINIVSDIYNGRYEKKDFFDIASLLKDYNLKDMIELYREKFNDFDDDKIISGLSRSHYADNKPDPVFLNELSWHKAKSAIEEAVNSYLSEKENKSRKRGLGL